MEVFKDYATYYDAFYGDKDYASEAKTVSKMIKDYRQDAQTVLNFGCGTGKHDMELCKLGYLCHGVDISSEMIRIANENSANIDGVSFEVGDIRHYHSESKYDAVISLFHVMSYQNSNADIINTLKSVRNAMVDGGVFIFDFWYGPGVLTDPPVVRVKEAVTEKYRLIRIARPIIHDDTNVVDVNYEVIITDKNGNTSSLRETHNMRYFFKPELEYYLNECGIKMIKMIDGSGEGDISFDSWTSYCIAILDQM